MAESPTPGVSPGLSLGRTGGNAAQVTYRGLWNVDSPDSTTLPSRNPTGPREGLQREHTAGAAARGWRAGLAPEAKPANCLLPQKRQREARPVI